MNITKKVLGFLGAFALMSSVSAQTLVHKGTAGAPGGMDIQILMAIDSAFQFDVTQTGLINEVETDDGTVSTADIDLGSYDYISGCATASANHAAFADIACGHDSLASSAAAVKVVMDFDSEVVGLPNGKVLDVVWDVSLLSLERGGAEQSSGSSDEQSHYIEIAASGLGTDPTVAQVSDTLSLAYDNDAIDATNDEAESFQVALKAPLAGADAMESIVGLLEGSFTVNNL